jgi:hypothetical protein
MSVPLPAAAPLILLLTFPNDHVNVLGVLTVNGIAVLVLLQMAFVG